MGVIFLALLVYAILIATGLPEGVCIFITVVISVFCLFCSFYVKARNAQEQQDFYKGANKFMKSVDK